MSNPLYGPVAPLRWRIKQPELIDDCLFECFLDRLSQSEWPNSGEHDYTGAWQMIAKTMLTKGINVCHANHQQGNLLDPYTPPIVELFLGSGRLIARAEMRADYSFRALVWPSTS